MTEKIPQYVIVDLLPLYLANEVGEETRNLIEEYLKNDPQLAKLADQAKRATSLQEIPAPLNKGTEMISFKKVKWLNFFLSSGVFITSATGLVLIFVIKGFPFISLALWAVASFLWYVFYRVNQ